MKTIKMTLLLTTIYFFMSVPSIVEAKDCSHLIKLHQKLICKAGSDKYGSDKYDETKTKKKKGKSLNEKYNSLTDIIKKLKGD